jgi:pyruvate dehydrogenase E2 component (dihydrolipoamide acetyltransferase)
MSAELYANPIDNSSSKSAPVLFLHGFGGSGSQWWGLQTAISFKAPTLAYDLPGHGKSLRVPKAGPPKVAARAVIADMDARGVDRAHLVGHSMGGAISSLIALMAPQRVASLTLLAPGGFGTELNHSALMDWAAARTTTDLQSVLPHFFGPDYVIPEKVVEHQLQLRAIPGVVDSLISIAEGLFDGGVQGKLPINDLLGLKRPISVIWGQLDNIVPVSQADQLHGHVDLHLLDRVGHSPTDESPDIVRKTILSHVAAG